MRCPGLTADETVQTRDATWRIMYGEETRMGPHQSFTRIPLQVGSELRIRNTGEISVSNPTIESGPGQDDAAALLDYRFDAQTAEHVLRLVQPSARPLKKRSGQEKPAATGRG
jgi:hypothetical protein